MGFNSELKQPPSLVWQTADYTVINNATQQITLALLLPLKVNKKVATI